MKKKIFCSINVVMLLITIISLILYLFLNKSGMDVFLSVMLIMLASLGLANTIAFKNKKSWTISGLILMGIIFQVISNSFIVKNPTLFWVLLCLSGISFVTSLIFNTKFSKTDILYIVTFVVPLVTFINIAPIFGFVNVANRLLVSFVVTLFASLSGLSFSHATRSKSIFNISFSLVAIVQLFYVFGLLVVKYSTITHKIEPLMLIVGYLILLLIDLTIFFIGHKVKNIQNDMKTSIAKSVCILLFIVTIAYTLASNFIALGWGSAKIYKSQYINMIDNLTLPIIEINTQDNQLPYDKEEYINCSFKISNCENDDYNFSVPMTRNYKEDGSVGIRLRGNSTMTARKRPYRIKFDEKKSLFGLKANKSWVLLADYYDQSYIRNYTAFTLADYFDNMDFVATPHHVALMINGEFKGLYLLCEQMDEKKGRADVDEEFDINTDTNFPFLVELDYYAQNEGVHGIDNFYVESVYNYVEIKFPEADERGATKGDDPVFDYIYEYINAAFKTITTNQKVEVSFSEQPVGLEDLIDVDSLVDYYLVNEIMVNTDNHYKSIYLHKTKDGKMKFGPIWDFDFSMATKFEVPYKESQIEDAYRLTLSRISPTYRALLHNVDFYNKVVTRYNEKSYAILETYNHLKDYKSVIDETAIIDSEMWRGITGKLQYDAQYDYVRLFLMERYNYLNEIFAKSHSEFLKLI